MKIAKFFKSDCFEEESKLVVYIEFLPHFRKEYSTIAQKFIPDNAKDLSIYKGNIYFIVPIEVKITKYDLI